MYFLRFSLTNFFIMLLNAAVADDDKAHVMRSIWPRDGLNTWAVLHRNMS